MMLHRHFEAEANREGMTTLADLTKEKQNEAFVSEVFPPDEKTEKPKRGRPKKTTDE